MTINSYCYNSKIYQSTCICGYIENLILLIINYYNTTTLTDFFDHCMISKKQTVKLIRFFGSHRKF